MDVTGNKMKGHRRLSGIKDTFFILYQAFGQYNITRLAVFY